MQTFNTLVPLAAAAVFGVLALDPAPPSAAQDLPATDSLSGSPTPAGAPAFAALEMFRLRDGRVLWGEFTEHDGASFEVRRLDTGGRARLPWSLLDPEQELEFKRLFGYIEIEQEDLTVEASVIPLRDGSNLTGVIELETADALHIKTETGLLVLPRDRVAGSIASTRVPARDIYSRQELYEQKRAEFLPRLLATGPDTAVAHVELARHCERILDYVNAVLHYEAAIAAGSTDEQIAGWLEIATRRAAAQTQVDALDAIDRLRREGKYPEAVAELGVFPQAWPTSPLMEDWAKLNQRVLKDRENDALRLVRDRWFYWLNRYTRDAAKDLGFEQAQAWVDETLAQVVLAQVTAEVQKFWPEASPSAVRDLFTQRSDVRVRGATYGIGTFLLGKERATATMKDDDEEAENPLEGLAKQRQELEERMEKFLSSQRARSTGQEENQVDPEEYWKSWNVAGRSAWLLAYYAEFSGDLELVRVTVEPHADCGGTGYIEILGTSAGGGVTRRLVPDPNCNGVGVKRRIKYK